MNLSSHASSFTSKQFLYSRTRWCMQGCSCPAARLLGWSAFAGFVVFLITSPLNNFVAKRSIRIQKGLSTARDKRMGVLNELISAVKFIKFFVWEERWIQRALDVREVELRWLIKGRISRSSAQARRRKL